METVGTPSDGSIAKEVVAKELYKLKNKLLELEDLYYSFRDDMEESIQNNKYRLDKMIQLMGDKEDVD